MVIGVIALVVFLILKGVFQLAGNVWKKVNPPPPPTPTIAFGKLPKIDFPVKDNPPQLTYTLETIEGKLPTLADTGKVYFIPQPAVSLLSLDRAKELAQRMNYRGEPEQINNTLYRWQNSQPPTQLELDKNTQNFTIRYDYRNDQELVDNKNLPNDQLAAQEAKGFLSTAGLLKDDLQKGEAEFINYRFTPPNLFPAASISETNLIRVNFFREKLDEMRILPPNPQKSLVSFLFSSSRTPGKRIVEVDFNYSTVNKENFATYPLKTVDQAWDELTTGKGYVATVDESAAPKVVIRKVSLAYYDSDTPQHYLQPIFVFEGDPQFIGYVSAVSSKWQE